MRAASIGHRALDFSGGLTSYRASEDLRELGRYAARHPKVPEALALRERIAASLPA